MVLCMRCHHGTVCPTYEGINACERCLARTTTTLILNPLVDTLGLPDDPKRLICRFVGSNLDWRKLQTTYIVYMTLLMRFSPFCTFAHFHTTDGRGFMRTDEIFDLIMAYTF